MFMRKFQLAAAALLAGAAPVFGQNFSAERIKSDVGFLADDRLEGRGTGTRGHELAALYVAERFAALGLTPGNGSSWYQSIPFVSSGLDPAKPSALTINGQRFANLEHVLVSSHNAREAIDETAPVVFVGYGLQDAKLGLDDYRGLDVRGKVVACLWGTPKGLPSEVAAALQDKKTEMAVQKGAIGVLTIETPALQSVFPWPRIVENSVLPKMRWVHRDGKVEDPTGSLRLSALIDPSATDALFAGSPGGNGKLKAIMADPAARPKGYALPARIRLERFSKINKVSSPNVIGFLPGSDPALAKEVIILSAHLDHLGIKQGNGGDRIYNGAMDNAAGVATMLEVARAFADSPQRPRRSIAFVALTGEEKGLLGSEYLAEYPLPDGYRPVGNVNLDEPMLTYDFTDVIAFGAEHSTIGKTVERAGKQMGVALSPDPAPEQNSFVRSDHYSFVKKGIPSISLATGDANGGKAATADYEEKRYHQVTDDMSQAFVWSAGAKFARLNYLISRELADAPDAPRWYANDYFGDKFAAGQPRAKP
jgi:hypothetical protein